MTSVYPGDYTARTLMHKHHPRHRRRGFGFGRRHRHPHGPGVREAELTVADLAVGETAVITGYRGGGASYRSKLLSMGLTRGTRIRLAKVAPFGDPVEIDVRDFRLSLRKEEARILMLERDDGHHVGGRWDPDRKEGSDPGDTSGGTPGAGGSQAS
ncbi:MAG: ferrous iron transport protein A [Spirochaetaceae bacterium]